VDVGETDEVIYIYRLFVMRYSYRLNQKEREYMLMLIGEAVESVKVRNTHMCTEHVINAIRNGAVRTMKLRQVVVDAIIKDGKGCIPRLINRHAAFKQLPWPLRGKALEKKGRELGLIQRTMRVRVDACTVKEECKFAQGRRDMKMADEIGKNCKGVVMQRNKRKKCVEGIIAEANEKGLADITRVWRDFQSCITAMEEVCLEAISAVATMKNVYVLDIHKLTCLFHFPVFAKVLDILTSSHIFAVNMGEDEGIFTRAHFNLLSSKILNGSSPIRRWFVELGRSRRQMVAECGLVKHNKPNVFALARREDKRLWMQGDRTSPRLAWLLAPASAYTVAMQYNTAMQDSTCNWERASAVRQEMESEARLLALACISTLTEH
jgi:hypothetical protein